MKKLIQLIVVACVVAVAYSVSSFTSSGFGDSTGAPMKSGVVSAYTSCNMSGCHFGQPVNNPNGQFTITSDIPASGWVPGTKYRITLTTNFSNRDVFGWQAMVWGNSDSASVGTISVPAGQRGRISISPLRRSGVIIDTNYYFTHSPVSVTSPVVGQNVLSFDWVAPLDPAGNTQITIYATSNAANGNGNNLGDLIYLANQTHTQAGVTSVGRTSDAFALRTYPNPATDYIEVRGAFEAAQSYTLSVADLSGKVWQKSVESGNAISKLDVTSLPAGVYFLKVTDAHSRSSVKSFVKK